MTALEFNEKYGKYLKEGHYGCALHNKTALSFLDWVFKSWVKHSRFKYSQIKMKFGKCCIYVEDVPTSEIFDVERVINDIYSLKSKDKSL